MRIAVLVYGRLAKCEDHYTSLLASLGPGTVDFFMSSDGSPQPHLDAFLHLYKPIAYTNEPITYTCDLGRYPTPSEGTASIHNMTCHFINKGRVFSLLEAHVAATQTAYDAVVCLRIDLLIRSPFPFGELVDKTVYIPEEQDWLGGINDQVAYGKLDAMKLYTGIFSTAETLLQTGMTVSHPESLTLANIRYTGLAVQRFPLTYSIVR